MRGRGGGACGDSVPSAHVGKTGRCGPGEAGGGGPLGPSPPCGDAAERVSQGPDPGTVTLGALALGGSSWLRGPTRPPSGTAGACSVPRTVWGTCTEALLLTSLCGWRVTPNHKVGTAQVPAQRSSATPPLAALQTQAAHPAGATRAPRKGGTTSPCLACGSGGHPAAPLRAGLEG